MNEALGYQYVVLRCVPDAVREEFINVGVVLYCQRAGFLDVAYAVDRERLQVFSPLLDMDELERGLREAALVCDGAVAPGRPELTRPGRRFGWLSAPRSTVLRPGPVHGGVTRDPAAELRRLLDVVVHSPTGEDG